MVVERLWGGSEELMHLELNKLIDYIQSKPGFFDNHIFLTYFAADCFFHVSTIVSTIEFPSGFFDTGFI